MDILWAHMGPLYMVYSLSSICTKDVLDFNLQVGLMTISPGEPNSFTSMVVELVVTGGPEQEAEVGDTATLLCNVTPSADPLLTWYKLRTGGTRTRILEQVFGEPWFGNLTIVGVTREDSGTYVCEASNQFGDEEATVDLIILSKFSIQLKAKLLLCNRQHKVDTCSKCASISK